MRKIFKSFVFCLGFILLFAGCEMKNEYGIVIDSDKDVSIQIVSAMDDELIDSMLGMSDSENEDENSEEKTYTDAERWQYIESNMEDHEGYTKEKYEKDGFKGFVFKKNLGNIDDLSSDSEEDVSLEEIEEDSKIFIKKDGKYTLNVKNDDENEAEMEEYKDSVGFDISLTVTLPNKAISNNATEVSSDGLTYTWDLLKEQNIELTFDFDNSKKNHVEPTTKKSAISNGKGEHNSGSDDIDKQIEEGVRDGVSKIIKYAVIGGAIFLGLVILIVIIVLVASSKKKKNQPNYDQMNIQQPMMNNQSYSQINAQPVNNQSVVDNQQSVVESQQQSAQTQNTEVYQSVKENQSDVVNQNNDNVNNNDESNNQSM